MTRAHSPMIGAFAAAGLVVLAALMALAAPPSVAARCFEPGPIEEAVRAADVVIVGTVTAVAEEGTLATVHVEEIWRGPALQSEVVVLGGPGGRSSLDRTFIAGTRYLFTITLAPDGRLTDSQCSSTVEWDAKLAALRPLDARAPGADIDSDPGADVTSVAAGLVVPAGIALMVAAALLIAGLLARGRQNR